MWAALPVQTDITLQNGSANLTGSGTTLSINSSDRAVIQWGSSTNLNKFTINPGETWNFQMPPGGAVLNRVGAFGSYSDNVAINGQLTSNGKVFVLANGAISVGSGATVSTSGGLVLSTLAETEQNGAFLATGDLLYTASATPGNNGAITIGSSSATVNVAGNIKAVGGSIIHRSSSVTGDMILQSVNSGVAMSLANAGLAPGTAPQLTVGGNLSVTTNAGAITQFNQGTTVNPLNGLITVGNPTAASQTATFSTGTAGGVPITLDGTQSAILANDFQKLVIYAPGAVGSGADVNIRDVNVVNLGDVTVGNDLTINAVGQVYDNLNVQILDPNIFGISNSGSVTVGRNLVLNTNASNTGRVKVSVGNVTIGSTGTVSGVVTTNSSFQVDALSDITVGSITAGGAGSAENQNTIKVTSTGNLTVAATSVIAASGNSTTGGGVVTFNGTNVTQLAGSTITAGASNRNGSVIMNATAGNVVIGTTSVSRSISLNATGTISQSGPITTTNSTDSTGITATYKAGGTIILDNAGNSIDPKMAQQFTGGTTANLTNTKPIVLGTTNVTGDLNLIATNATAVAGITLGTGLGTLAQKISVGGNLSATVAGGVVNTGQITDNDYTTFNVFGGVNLNTALGGGAIVLDAGSSLGSLAPRSNLGVINANAGTGAVVLSETTTLNLGTITGSSLTAKSVTENIIDSGNFAVTTATLSVTGNNSITLDSTGHTIGTLNIAGSGQASVLANSNVNIGAATILTGNLAVTTNSGFNIVVSGAAVTGGLSLNSGGTLAFNTAASTVTGDLAFNAAGAVTQGAGIGLTVTGNTSVAGAGVITLSDTTNSLNNVILNNVTNTGTTTIWSARDLTVSGTAAGLLNVKAGAGPVASTWNLVLGNLSVGSLTAETFDGGGGQSGTITQVAKSSIHSEGATSFKTTDNIITLTNAGNSFGGVSLTVAGTTGSRTVQLTEDSTLKLAGLSSRGTTNLTSRTGSIIEAPDANVVITNNGTLNLTASAGSVLIGGTTKQVGFTTSGNLTAANITAPNGAAAVISNAGNGNIALGTTNVGSLNVVATGGGNNGSITQSKPLKVYGSATFTASNNITLGDEGNNFGRVSLTTTNSTFTSTTNGFRDLVISEGGTLNLGLVSMPAGSTGNFTATSVTGDIIDTGLAGLKPGGTTASIGSGVVTLMATAGNIVLDDPTTDFPTSGGVVFSAKNVTLSPLGNSPLTLGSVGSTSVATGNLIVTSAIGNINSNGALNVTGDAMFQSGNGSITVAQSGNKFGSLKFSGTSVAIVESDDMVLVTGSAATSLTGSAQLSSGGNITVKNTGGSINFNNSAFLSATGSITLPKGIQAVGTLTVNAAGTKDLSALSKSSDLNNKDVTNLGTGTYIAPGQ